MGATDGLVGYVDPAPFVKLPMLIAHSLNTVDSGIIYLNLKNPSEEPVRVESG